MTKIAGSFQRLRHVEALVDLALVRSTIAEISDGDTVIAAIPIGESEARTERDLGADDAVAAVKLLLHAEHVHGAALALGIAAAAAGEFGHDAIGFHAGGEHVAVIAIAGDDLVAVLQRHLHADHHGLLADIEMAEAADRTHAVELAGLFLEPPDQEHFAERLQLLLPGEFRGEPPLVLSCGELAAAFLGAAMGNSGSEKTKPSLTQLKRARKRCGDAIRFSLCRSAA